MEGPRSTWGPSIKAVPSDLRVVLRHWGHQLSEAEGTKMQRIAMKFDMLKFGKFGLGENAVSFDEIAQKKCLFWDTLMEQESRRTIT